MSVRGVGVGGFPGGGARQREKEGGGEVEASMKNRKTKTDKQTLKNENNVTSVGFNNN